METALQTSGRILNAREAETLSGSAERFANLSGSGDIVGAIKAINKAGRVGVPGQIPSFAQSAMEVNKLVKDMATEVMTKLEELDGTIESSQSTERVDAVLASLKLASDYGGLKVLKPEFKEFKKKLGKNKEISQIVKEAKIINSAVTATSKTAAKRGMEKLKELIDATEIDEIKTAAQAALDDLSS